MWRHSCCRAAILSYRVPIPPKFFGLVANVLACNLNYFAKLFHQTVHALSAKSCKTRCYINLVCCSFKIVPLQLRPGTR